MVATAFYSTAAVPLAASVFAALGGIVASLLAMVELIWPPSADVGSSFPTAAAGLATASAVGLALCSLVSMSGERRTLPRASPIPMTPAPPVAS
jgi:hypothetical protein